MGAPEPWRDAHFCSKLSVSQWFRRTQCAETMAKCSLLHVSPKRARSSSNAARPARDAHARAHWQHARATRAFFIAAPRAFQSRRRAARNWQRVRPARAARAKRARNSSNGQHVTRARAPAARTRNARAFQSRRRAARNWQRVRPARAARAKRAQNSSNGQHVTRARAHRQRARATRAF